VQVPLYEKIALDYAEVAALGLCSERKLREHVVTGRVKRAVLRDGRRVRFLRTVLIEELQQMDGA
jgi:hypothetical protein